MFKLHIYKSTLMLVFLLDLKGEFIKFLENVSDEGNGIYVTHQLLGDVRPIEFEFEFEPM